MSEDEIELDRLRKRVAYLEKQLGEDMTSHFNAMELMFLWSCLSEASDSLSHAKHNEEECEAITFMMKKISRLPNFDFDVDVAYCDIMKKKGAI